MLNDALADALDATICPAPRSPLIDELGQRGGRRRALYAADAKPRRSRSARTTPNRRVRFAALRAIMALDPQSPYPGSSRVPDALAYFAASGGDRRAIVAMPTAARATDLAGQLAATASRPTASTTAATRSTSPSSKADLELVLVDMNICCPKSARWSTNCESTRRPAKCRSRSWPPMAGSKRPNESPPSTSA